MRRFFLSLLPLPFIALSWNCKSIQPIQPPEFRYKILAKRFFDTNPHDNFPLTVQRGANLYSATSENGFLFYTTNKDGSGDIWMRSLKNSINLPVVQHPAEQKMPASSADGSILVFVSEDRDSQGDLMLLSLQARDIEKNALQGLPPVNLWKNSINLSKEIEGRARESLPGACHGPAMESSPSLSADAKTLVFVSDRCSPGRPNLWMLRLGQASIQAGPFRLTQKGGFQARLSRDGKRVFFVSKRNGRPNGAIYLLYLQGNYYQKDNAIHISLAEENKNYLYASPAISSDGRFLFYQSVRQDTNQNGRLDLNDKSGIYKVALGFRPDGQVQTSPEKQLLAAEHSILSMVYSNFIGGSVLYATRILNNVNIYFINSDGIIPRQTNIEEQYLLAEKYKKFANKRYALALDAVFNFYGDGDEFDLYEAKILLDKYNFYKKTGLRKKLQRLKQDIAYVRQNNSYADLEFRLQELPAKQRLQILKEYIRKLSKENEGGSDKNMPLFQAAALFRLAKLQSSAGRYADALYSIRRLNQNVPDFYLINQSLLLEADASTILAKKLSPLYAKLLSQGKIALAFADQIHKHIYDRCLEITAPKKRQAFLEESLRLANPPIIQATLRLAEAQSLYDAGKAARALQILQTLVAQIPQEPYRKRTRPLLSWNGLTVRAWKLIARINKESGNYAAAYLATLNYGGTIYEKSSATIDIQEFYSIIEESDNYIQDYLSAARKLARLVEEREEAKLQEGLIEAALQLQKQVGQSLNKKETPKIPLDPNTQDLLGEFCKSGSQNNHLFFSLGEKHLKDYQAFCLYYAHNQDTGFFPLEIAKQASSLLFTVSYANANVLNILFFNMNQSSVFWELYKEKAAYYHKLKIDVAREKLQIEMRREQKKFFLPGQKEALLLLIENDPFDSKIYNELEYGYLLTRSENVEIGDTAMLFGHAYLLITRATEQEGYYRNFQKKAGRLSTEFLREKKQKILQDLKNAEYILKYIINIDSRNADAYLLLGWLYEYLDRQQSSVLKIEPSYTEKLFDYLTGTRQDTLDKIEYADLYRTYFNFRFYEENIELYRQILDTTSHQSFSKKALLALHLNLGNNYFKLLNFPKAIRHYDIVHKLLQKHGDLFENYRQKALFHANRGRAFFYAAQSAKAAKSFFRAVQIYKKEELSLLLEKKTEAGLKPQAPKGSQYYKIQQIQKKRLQEKIRASQKKIALLLSLQGLADWDAGRPTEAVLNYLDAHKRLFGDVNNENANNGLGNFSEAALMNFLALAQQQGQNYASSNRSAIQASRLARNKRLAHPQDAFQPKSLGGRLLGCVIPFGEDFSVIGKGRNPYGFTSLRLYELSLGIQFQNKVLQGDLDGADYLMRQREQVFLNLEGKRKTGQIGYINILNQKGLEFYNRLDFEQAQRSFQTAGEVAFSHGNYLGSFKLNFYNRFKVLFAKIEKKLNEFSSNRILEKEIRSIDGYMRETEGFKEKFREKLIEAYIKDKQSENLDYEYQEELEKNTINRILEAELLELSEIQALLKFYQGLLLTKTAQNAGSLRRGFGLLRETEKEFAYLIQARRKQGVPIERKILRWQLNRAQAALLSGNFHLSRKEATKVLESAFEYNMLEEQFFAHFVLAQIPHNQTTKRKAGFHIERSLQILKKNTELFYHIEHRLWPFFHFVTNYYLLQKKYKKALQAQEWAWELKLSKEYFRYPLHFEDEKLSKLYRTIRKTRRELRLLAESESRLRMQHIDTKKIALEKEKLKKTLKKASRQASTSFPLHRPFLEFSLPEEVAPKTLARSQILMRFYRSNRHLGLWCMTSTRLNFFQTKTQAAFADTLKENARKLFLQCLGRTSYHDIFVIEDDAMPFLPLQKWSGKNKSKLVFLSRVSDLKAGFADHPSYLKKNLNYFNVNGPSDILQISLPSRLQSPLFSTGKYRTFDPRKWVYQERFSSVVLATNEGTLLSTKKRKLYYELFRLKGVSCVLFSTSPKELLPELLAARAQRPYALPALYGNAGFDYKSIRSYIQKAAQRRIEIGKSYEKKGELDLARIQYRLAESYLHPPNLELKHSNFANRLNLLRLDLKLDYNTPASKLIEPLLDETQQAAKKAKVLKVAVLTLVELGEAGLAEKYKKAYISLRPHKRAEIELQIEAKKFVVQLESLDPVELSISPLLLEKKFKKLLPVFTKQTELLRLLWKHQFYHLARLLIQNQKQKRNDLPEIQKLEKEILFEKRLIENPQQLPQKIVLKGEAGLEKFLKVLVREWKKKKMNLPFDITSLQNAAFQKQSSIYASLDYRARSLLLQLLIANIPYDSNLLAMRFIEELIRIEAQTTSTRRAARMALLASETYLFLHDFELAARFYRVYKKYPKDFSEKPYIREALSRLSLLPQKGPVLSVKEAPKAFKGASKEISDETYKKTSVKKANGVAAKNSLQIYTHIPEFPNPGALKNYESVIVEFLQENPGQARQAILSIQIAKVKALKKRNWIFLLDLDFMQHRLRKLISQKSFSFSGGLYKNMAQTLLHKLPARQEFLAFLPFSQGSIRLSWKKNHLEGALWPSTDRRFLSTLRTYIQHGYGGKRTSYLQFRSKQIFGPTSANLRYFWLSGSMVFLPVRYGSKSRLFQILLPDAFTRNTPLSDSRNFKNGFSIQYQSRSCSAEDLIDIRLKNMEEFIIKKNNQKNSHGKILHISTRLSCLFEPREATFFSAKGQRAPEIVVLPRADFSRHFSSALAAWYKMLGILEKTGGKKGVLNVRSGDGTLHPEFVKQLYRTNLKLHALENRFRFALLSTEAFARAQALSPGSYRLFTNYILLKDSKIQKDTD